MRKRLKLYAIGLHRRFPGAKGARLHFPNTVAAEFTGSEPIPVDYNIWSVPRAYCRRKFTDPQ